MHFFYVVEQQLRGNDMRITSILIVAGCILGQIGCAAGARVGSEQRGVGVGAAVGQAVPPPRYVPVYPPAQ
jgi:hypothetical protein